MDSAIDLVSFVTRAENRVSVLLSLAAGPRTRPDLQAETDVPRATLSRILADFRERDLAVREGHEYRTTALGDPVAAELESLFDAVAAMETLQTVREWLSVEETGLPVERLTDADVIVPEPGDPTAPIRRAEALLADASRVRVVARSMIPGCLEAVWRAVTEGRQTLELVTTPDALEIVAEDPVMAEQARDLLAVEEASTFVHGDDLPPAIIVVDEAVFLAVADDAGTIQGHVETADEAVRAWAEATVEDYRRAAAPVSTGVLTA